jgi:hypothetical protein
MKKILACLLAVLLLALALGCSSGDDKNDPNLGVYTAKTAEYSGITLNVDQFFEKGFTIELKSGGKCKLTADGESANGKWTLDGTKFHVEGGGIECDGTLENGVMSIDYDGVVFNLINEAYAAPAAQAPAPALR